MRTFIVGLIAFCFFQLSCTKNDNLTNTAFRVKIIKEVCNDAIVQLVDKQSTVYAENDFSFEGKYYDNVFFTTFRCADKAKIQTLTSDLSGLVITVKLLNAAMDDPNCGRCLATVNNRPGKFNLIEVIGL
ncbi:MAG: hypothetical protein RI983_1606 [Bacteroidota bacterium]|jgi:hypothetical protein